MIKLQKRGNHTRVGTYLVDDLFVTAQAELLACSDFAALIALEDSNRLAARFGPLTHTLMHDCTRLANEAISCSFTAKTNLIGVPAKTVSLFGGLGEIKCSGKVRTKSSELVGGVPRIESFAGLKASARRRLISRSWQLKKTVLNEP